MRETPEIEGTPFIVRTPTIAGGTRGSVPDFNGAYCVIEEPGIVLAGAQYVPWLNEPGMPGAGEEWSITEEFIISTDGASASVYILCGELDYYSSPPDGPGNAVLFVAADGPKESIISTGQKLTLTDTGTVTTAAFTASELNSLVEQQDLKAPELISEQDVQACFPMMRMAPAAVFGPRYHRGSRSSRRGIDRAGDTLPEKSKRLSKTKLKP